MYEFWTSAKYEYVNTLFGYTYYGWNILTYRFDSFRYLNRFVVEVGFAQTISWRRVEERISSRSDYDIRLTRVWLRVEHHRRIAFLPLLTSDIRLLKMCVLFWGGLQSDDCL